MKRVTVLVFTHASLWPFLLALGVPVWLHLRRKRNAQTQVLPTFALLQSALGRQTPVLRWRQILLLITRLLALLFLILAFEKPVVPAVMGRSNGGGRAVVFALDVSLSMQATQGSVSALERAKGRILGLMDDLRQGDTANVIVFGATARPVLPKLSGDFGTLRQAVRSATADYERGNPTAALTLAASELAASNAPRRELVIASDFQKTNGAADAQAALPDGAKLILLQANDAPPDNAAITGLRLPTLAPLPGEPTQLTAEVWNGSPAPCRLTVSLEITAENGEKSGMPEIAPQSVAVPPYASANVAFSVAFPDPARYRVTAHLLTDSLPAADSRYLVADLQNRLRVLLLADSRFGPLDSATYLKQALNPAPESVGGFQVVTRRPSELSAADLRFCDVAVCCDIEAFPPDKMDALAHYAQDGGAILYFLTNPQAAAQIAALAKRAPANGELPFVPETYLDARLQSAGYVKLNPVRSQSPLLRLFADPSVADITQIRFTRYFLTAPPDPASEILLTFENGTPALARRDFGRGSVLLANFSASPQAGDLAKQTLFPPLVHELTQGMAAQGRQRGEILCGDAADEPIDRDEAGETLRANGPDGSPPLLHFDRERGIATVLNLARPGFYRIESGGRTAALFAVNPPPEESDLRPADLKTLETRSAARVIGAGNGAIDSLRYKVELWPFCALLALLFLLLESALSSNWR